MSPDPGASNFDRLHPSVRYLVQEVLRFPGQRPVKDATIGPVLAGRDCVVIAPTAGGKTEAAAFPVLSRILSERMEPVAALYICPLRALVNNRESRLTRMAEACGLRVGKWHGALSAATRKQIIAEPPDIRSRAEELPKALQAGGVPVWVQHSPVGIGARDQAELAFENAPDATLVATSSLELGIDIGDLDHIFQFDAPSTVSSLAQRLGRTGRRAGSVPRMIFIADAPEDLLLAEGWLEEADGVLLIGRRAEKSFGARNFFRLCAVFESPSVLTVLHGNREVGTIQSWFAGQLTAKKAFRLAGKGWTAEEIDLDRGIIRARPAAAGVVPSWTGRPSGFSRAVCERILELIIGEGAPEGASAAE